VRIGIRAKILIAFAATLIITSALNLFFISQILRKDYSAALQSKLLLLGDNLERQLKRITSLGISTRNIEGFSRQCFELVEKNEEVARVMVVDKNGTVIFHSDPSYQGKKVDNKDILSYIGKGKTGVYTAKESYDNFYCAITPFGDELDRSEYAIIICSPTRVINETIVKLINRSNSVLFSTFGLGVLLLLVFLTSILTKPLAVILSAMKDITKTRDLQKRVDVKTNDEISEIADAFNQMTADLQNTTISVDELNREIAERKRMEEKLQLTQFSIDNSPDSIFRIGPDAKFLYANKSSCELLEYSHDELLSMAVYDVNPDFPKEKWNEHWQDIKQKGSAVFESRNKTKSGRIRPVEIRVFYVNFEGGEYMFAFTRDISERRKTEQERLNLVNRIKRQEAAIVKIATNQALANSDAGDAVKIITEITAHTLKVARVSVWLLNKDRTALECMNLFKVADGKHSQGMSLSVNNYPNYFKALQSGRAIDAGDAQNDSRTSEFTKDYLIPNDIVSMLDTAIRVSGETVGIVCHESIGSKRIWTADEITFASEIADQVAQAIMNVERRKAENDTKKLNKDLEKTVTKLERTNQEMQDFIYVASHDLREPLHKIAIFGDMLQKSLKGKLEKEDAENLQYMIEGTERINNVIGGLLTYAKVNSKEQRLEVVNLNDIIKQLQQLEFSLLLQETQAVIEIPQPLTDILFDPVQMRQLMHDLIANGIKYQKKGNTPHITITSKPAPNEMIRVEVKDNGIGIKPEYQQAVFSLFKRLHLKEEYTGTGVGLATCKKIVEHYGGQIGVESEYDKGSTFWFTVPAAGKAIAADTDPKTYNKSV
jgi:PAS domain S-box-containing protein